MAAWFCYNPRRKLWISINLQPSLKSPSLASFSRAGQKLFRSQPAVSAQVRQIKQEYGEKLFDRGRKSVRLTSAGETLFEYAVRMVNMRGEYLNLIVLDIMLTLSRVLVPASTSEATLASDFAMYFSVYRNARLVAGFLRGVRSRRCRNDSIC